MKGKKHLKLLIWVAIGEVLSTSMLAAQSLPSPEDPIWRYESWLETAGLASTKDLGLRSIDTVFETAGGPWSHLYNGKQDSSNSGFVPIYDGVTIEAGTTWNSAFPTSVNIGGLWEGVGFTPWTKSSVEGSLGPFWGRLGIAASFSQNSDFKLGPSGLSDQALASVDGANIDTPQRYGTTAFGSYSLDNWELGAKFGPVIAAFSDQNLWFGPAVFNPLLLSAQAEGFPHIQVGVDGWETPIGNFESQLVYGKLTTSKFWDPKVNNGDRFFGGFFLGYKPSFFPELTIGAGRTVFSYWNSLNWRMPLILFIPGIDNTGIGSTFGYGTGESHQHISITWRLQFPGSGFETYGEWGKNDFSPLRLLLLNPDHMQAYTIGLKKAFEVPGDFLLGIGAELTDLSQSKESLINYNGYNWGGDWYSHWAILEGYTNNGQVLGASIGNGSAAQVLYADLYGRSGHLGIELRRWADRVSALYQGALPTYREYQTDVEYDVGLRLDVPVQAWIHSLSVQWQYDCNRYMIVWNDVLNWHVAFSTSLRL
ncbi:MAG: hypothetical protein M0001_09245 [Treponema sp.]|nr:hypothetical protein [Treponema sp.]